METSQETETENRYFNYITECEESWRKTSKELAKRYITLQERDLKVERRPCRKQRNLKRLVRRYAENRIRCAQKTEEIANQYAVVVDLIKEIECDRETRPNRWSLK